MASSAAKDKVLKPVRPNLGFEVAYRSKLLALIEEMQGSVVYWLKAAYRSNEPLMAQDAPDAGGFTRPLLPAKELEKAMQALAARWLQRFDEAAPKLAEFFGLSIQKRSDAALQKILKDAGFAVKFRMTRAARDVLNATINQQVGLIKSIPAQYLTNVQGLVMRSVQTGRDLGQLTKDLQEQFGVTKRRAAFIARDQNNKSTAAMTRSRQDELGLSVADWMHSGGGRHPRPTHVAMNGKRYDIKKGMWDPAVKRWILPGEEPGCRCVSRAVIPGFV